MIILTDQHSVFSYVYICKIIPYRYFQYLKAADSEENSLLDIWETQII